MTDPIADMLIRIKNASLRRKPFCRIPFSKLKVEILRVLEREKLVGEFKTKGKIPRKVIEVSLLYKNKEPIFKDVKRISKPGRRIYSGWQELNQFGKKGLLVLSTPQGIMTAKEARRKKIGGEVLFKVNP